jgi:hypothetical protein
MRRAEQPESPEFEPHQASRVRHAAAPAKRTYDDFVEIFREHTLIYLLEQLRPGIFDHNVECGIIGQDYVRALHDTIAAKRDAGEPAKPAKPKLIVARACEEEDREGKEVQMVESGGRGRKIRVLVPKSKSRAAHMPSGEACACDCEYRPCPCYMGLGL